VTNTWSPQTIGVPPLQDGSGVFQTMFSSVVQVVARPVESLMPLPSGPRHCGQFSPAAAWLEQATAARTSAAYRAFMGRS
jgi:hypothetical protein